MQEEFAYQPNKQVTGGGSVFFDEKKKKWVGRVPIGYYSNGTRKYKQFQAPKQGSVKKMMEEYKNLMYNGEDRFDGTLLENFIRMWFQNIKGPELKESSYDRAYCVIEHNIIPRIGKYKLKDITPEVIKICLLNSMQTCNSPSTKKPYSFSTIKKAYVYLNACLNYAVETKKILSNPCNLVKLPNKANFEIKEIRFFTDNEISKFEEKALLRAERGGAPVYKYGWACVFDIYTGLRVGEIIGLKWKNVDFQNGRIFVEEEATPIYDRSGDKPKKKMKHLNTTKRNRRRYVPLSNKAWELLRERDELRVDGDDNKYVLTNSDYIMSTNNMIRMYKSICERAKIENPNGFHTLRHTCASLLFRKGADAKQVSAILGHKSVAFTYDTYIHIIEEQKVESIALLDV